MKEAIEALAREGGFDAVLYNAAVVKAVDIMDEDPALLVSEFTVNVASALTSLQATYEGLKQNQGAFLLTGDPGGIRSHQLFGHNIDQDGNNAPAATRRFCISIRR